MFDIDSWTKQGCRKLFSLSSVLVLLCVYTWSEGWFKLQCAFGGREDGYEVSNAMSYNPRVEWKGLYGELQW